MRKGFPPLSSLQVPTLPVPRGLRGDQRRGPGIFVCPSLYLRVTGPWAFRGSRVRSLSNEELNSHLQCSSPSLGDTHRTPSLSSLRGGQASWLGTLPQPTALEGAQDLLPPLSLGKHSEGLWIRLAGVPAPLGLWLAASGVCRPGWPC